MYMNCTLHRKALYDRKQGCFFSIILCLKEFKFPPAKFLKDFLYY